MNKKLIWIGLATLTLILAAAQCGAPQPQGNTAAPTGQAQANDIEANQAEMATESQPPQPEQAEAGAANNRPEMESEPQPEQPKTANTTGQARPGEETIETTTHSNNNCTDPLAEVENANFSAQLWNAESLSRFVGSDIIDPTSNKQTNFCIHSVDYSQIISGGPPPDGIPPIDNPNFDPIEVGDEWLSDVQPVIALAVDGQAKAYPLAILTRHEIANDEIAGIPVAVTFCPLCNAAIVFDRRVNDQVLRFGVSGNLRNSDLIMWDNQTLSWWQQFTGEAIVGDMTGAQLKMIPAQLVAWKDFKTAYPAGLVLSGNGRNYGQNPYVGYDSSTRPFLFFDAPDPRLKATDRVLGYFSGNTALAYPLATIADKKIIEDTLDGQNVVIFYEPGQVSALDQDQIDRSREVGSAGMFSPVVDGQKLTFAYKDGAIVDNETGSQWDVFGRAIDGKLTGAQLEPILSHVHFWFAWAAFRPDTQVYEN